MALPSIADLKMWVGTLFTKDDWDFNFSQLVSWLADGSGDLVVNTIKTTNGIDLDGAQISNIGQATEGSQAINLDQALTLLNRSSTYYPFSVASGKVDSNGDAAYIQKVSDTEITVLAGNTNPDLVCVSSDGTIESVTSNVTLTVPVSDGTYHIIKEKAETVTITTGVSGKVSIGKVQPTSPNVGDYWLDNSVVPFAGHKYGLSGWEDVSFCYLGYVTVVSNSATVSIFNYNNNRFDVNKQSLSLVMPDYSKAYTITTSGTAASNGYIYLYGAAVEGSQILSLTIDGTTILLNGALTNREGGHYPGGVFPIAKGSTYVAGGSVTIISFIPLKGEG